MLFRLPFLALAALVALTFITFVASMPATQQQQHESRALITRSNLPAGFERLARRAEEIEARNADVNKLGRRAAPLADGFPTPNPAQLAKIEETAMGTVPNGPLPKKLDPDSITALQLVAFNEMMEVALFNSLVTNITTNAKGYSDFQGETKDYVLKVFKTVLAQEEIHAISANAALKSAGAPTIAPCGSYHFPATTFEEGVLFADEVTALVLGVLQNVASTFAKSDDARGLVGLVASVVGQEGEQRGYYRRVGKHVPSSLPFGTQANVQLAWNALQQFVSDCPSAKDIKLKAGEPVTVVFPPKESVAATTVLSFKANTTTAPPPAGTDANQDKNKHPPAPGASSYFVTYINQLNTPVTVPAKINNPPHGAKPAPGTVEIMAPFPLHEHKLNGLTLALVGTQKGPFATLEDAVKGSVAGPGLIYFRPLGL